MAKLPPEFVKAPITTEGAPAPKRRGGKSTLVAADARDIHDVMLRLTDDELRALEQARAELRSAGEDVTLEEMIHRVITDWSARASMTARASATPAPVASEPRIESLLGRLRAVARSPLQTWRELGVAVRRWMPV
jgi:hypothetical protein